jgi:hypothetical protein
MLDSTDIALRTQSVSVSMRTRNPPCPLDPDASTLTFDL